MEIPTDICDKSLDDHREDYRPVTLTLLILIETDVSGQHALCIFRAEMSTLPKYTASLSTN
jgi:hypothetical protein